jgi:homoaconitase/3-isopropylmalate dehydratase large subunit
MGTTYTTKVRVSQEANVLLKQMALEASADAGIAIHTAEVIEYVKDVFIKPNKEKIVAELSAKKQSLS